MAIPLKYKINYDFLELYSKGSFIDVPGTLLYKIISI